MLGCAIAPVLAISANALVAQTAMLKRVDFATQTRLHRKEHCRVDPVRCGLGYACLIEGMIERFRKEWAGGASVLTGGLATSWPPNSQASTLSTVARPARFALHYELNAA